MIRSTVTAHLAETDRSELTLQINDRDIGVLAAQEQRHYVMSGNRRVQMIAGLHTNPADHASVVAARALLRNWLVSFRELQINGLNRFPLIAERNRLNARFLLLMDSDYVLVWCKPQFGVYLHRGHHLYRQQPTYRPDQPSLAHFGRSLDFYAFRAREGDDLLIIDPAFIDLFDAVDLEDLLVDIHQINVSMTELTRLAQSYGRKADTTWFSAQVQRLEADLEMLSAESRERVSGRRSGQRQETRWLDQLRLSKVVPLLDGNVRVNPEGLVVAGHTRPMQALTAYEPKAPVFQSVWQQGQDTSLAGPIRRGRSGPEETRGGLGPAATQGGRKGLLDRAKRWNTNAIRDSLLGIHRRMTHLVPGSRGLSVLAYIALWLVILVLLVSAVYALKGDGKDKNGDPDRPKVTGSDPAVSTPKTEFEIDLVVKASSLRVVSSPGGDELVASLTRGDKVTQLTGAKDGWVLIRLADGRSGYVPESLLLASDDGS